MMTSTQSDSHSETQQKCSKSGLTRSAIINGDVLDWYLLDSSPLDLPLLLNVLEYDPQLDWILYYVLIILFVNVFCDSNKSQPHN